MGSLAEIFSAVLHDVDRRHCIYADLLRCLSVGSAQSQDQIYVFTAAESVITELSMCQLAFLSLVSAGIAGNIWFELQFDGVF